MFPVQARSVGDDVQLLVDRRGVGHLVEPVPQAAGEAPEYVEDELSPLGELVEYLAEVLGMDHIRVIADCGMEAGG